MSITPEAEQAAKELGEMDDEEFAAAMDNAREILNPDHLTIGVVDTETTGLDLESGPPYDRHCDLDNLVFFKI